MHNQPKQVTTQQTCYPCLVTSCDTHSENEVGLYYSAVQGFATDKLCTRYINIYINKVCYYLWLITRLSVSTEVLTSQLFLSGVRSRSPALKSEDLADLRLAMSDVPGDATWGSGGWMWENILATSWRHASSSSSDSSLIWLVSELQNDSNRRGKCNDCVSLYVSWKNKPHHSAYSNTIYQKYFQKFQVHYTPMQNKKKSIFHTITLTHAYDDQKKMLICIIPW